jgi:hypothetical protein
MGKTNAGRATPLNRATSGEPGANRSIPNATPISALHPRTGQGGKARGEERELGRGPRRVGGGGREVLEGKREQCRARRARERTCAFPFARPMPPTNRRMLR